MNESLPIRYAGCHAGRVRTLTLTLWGSRWWSGPTAHVNIDGFNHVVPWGTSVFEIPADRAVTVSVYQLVNTTAGLATTTLAPHHPPVLEYRSPSTALGHAAELGPPGKTRPRGSLSPVSAQVTVARVIGILLMVPAVIIFVLLLVAVLL